MLKNHFNTTDKAVSIVDFGELNRHKIYTVKNICYTYVLLYETIWSYDMSNFITLKEYRKLKIEKLNKNV
jgi:hypothetical protein